MAVATPRASNPSAFRSPRQRQVVSPAGSARSHRSMRSDASRLRLQQQHEQVALKSKILKDMQMKAKKGGRHMSKQDFRMMSQLAEEEAGRLLSNGQGLGPTTLLAQLSARRHENSAQAPESVVLPPITPRNAGLQSDKPNAPSATTARERKPLRVNIAGKDMPLSTMIYDKITQRGAGGAHQLRKAFKVLDRAGTGFVTMEQFGVFLREMNININPRSLENCFVEWTGSAETPLNYINFIQKILPLDFPANENPEQIDKKRHKVQDISSLARQNKSEFKCVRLKEWEERFRDKLTTKTKGGPFQLRKFWKLFDLDGNGSVTIEEIIKVAESWNLFASERVEQQLRKKFCRPEHQADGIIEFYDFVKHALPQDFSSADDAIVALKEKLSTKVNQLRKMFRDIDEDRSGTITRDEIYMAFRNQNIQVDNSVIDRIIDKIDFDGDGGISLDELAGFFENLEPKELPGLGGNLIWDGKTPRRVNLPPKTAASINSDVGMPDDHNKAGGIIVDVTNDGGFIADLGTGRGQSVDLFDLVRDKVYRKYKTNEFFNAIRIACLANKDTKFQQDRGPGTEGMLSLELLRIFLYRACGLRLTPAAFSAFVRIFDKAGTGMVEISHFGQMIVGHDYPADYISMPSEKEAASQAKLVPAPPTNPRSLEAYGVRRGDPVELVRYLICQRAGPGQNSHRMGPRRRLRDAFNRADPAGDGCVTKSDFATILKDAFNIEMDDISWKVFDTKYKYMREDGRVNYGGFLKEVLETDSGGHYHPHMGRSRGEVLSVPSANGSSGSAKEVVMDAAMVDMLKKLAHKVETRKKNIGMVFRELDEDKSGALEPEEFKKALKDCLGMDLEQTDFDRLMDCLDRDGSGAIDYQEFVVDMADIDQKVGHQLGDPRGQQKIMAEVFRKGPPPARVERAPRAPQAKHSFKTQDELVHYVCTKIYEKSHHIRKVFRSFDENKDGTVSAREFRFGLKQIGLDLSDADFDMLVNAVDSDGSGNINYAEFVDYLKFADEQDGGYIGDPHAQKMMMGARANSSHKMKFAGGGGKTAKRVPTATVTLTL